MKEEKSLISPGIIDFVNEVGCHEKKTGVIFWLFLTIVLIGVILI